MASEYIEIIATQGTPKRAKLGLKPRELKSEDKFIEIIEPDASRPRGNMCATAAAMVPASPIVTQVSSPGQNSNPIDYGDTLKACSSVDEVRDWLLAQQASFAEKVERGFGWRMLSHAARAKAQAILDGGSTPAFLISNDSLAIEAFEKLRTHFKAYVSADPANEIALFTFISGDGGTSIDRPVIEVRNSRKRVNDAMRKLVPHWFGLVDLAFFWTIQHSDGGLHLQRHEHVFGWGPGILEKAESIAAKLPAKFTPNVTNLPIIKVTPGWDRSEVNLARLAAYLLKAPARGKNWFEYPDGRYLMNHTEKKDRFIQFLRLAQVRSMLTLDDVILGGGDGIKIKGSMNEDMRELARARARGRDAIPPDLIPTCWQDFNGELGQNHWSVPAILRR